MGRWLSKMQKSTGQPPYKTYESTSVGSVGSPPGAFEEKRGHGPMHDIDTILDFMVGQVGRNLGSELERRIRKTMIPMSRTARAELAAALDDAFEVAVSVEAARWQCHRLLSDAKALAEAKAAWPGYPRGNT